MNNVDGGLLDTAYVEGVSVDELDDDDAKDVVIGDVIRDEHFRQAAQQFAQRSGAACRRMIRGEQFEQVIAHGEFLLVENRVRGAIDQLFRRNHAGEGRDLAAELQRVSHRQGIGMAWDRNNIFGLKDLRLLEDFPPDLGQSQAVGGGIEILQTSSILDGLKRFAADARLLQGVVDGLANFVVVQAFFQRDHQIRRDVVAIQSFESVDANPP